MNNLFNTTDAVVREIYEALIKGVDEFGDVIVEPKKASIHLKSRAAFAGVHPRKKYIILNIVSDSPIKSLRIVKQEQVSKNRFHNEVKLENTTDVDNELLEWLKNAYKLMK